MSTKTQLMKLANVKLGVEKPRFAKCVVKGAVNSGHALGRMNVRVASIRYRRLIASCDCNKQLDEETSQGLEAIVRSIRKEERDKAYKAGVAVSYVEKGNIIRKYPDGKVVIVSKILGKISVSVKKLPTNLKLL